MDAECEMDAGVGWMVSGGSVRGLCGSVGWGETLGRLEWARVCL